MAEKQTAGRDRLGDIAPEFAHLNDDVLFGEVWSREEELSARDRSLITIAALFSAGLYPQLKSHLALGRQHGITKQEAIEAVTQLAFYCGRPKAWSTFPMIEEVWGEEFLSTSRTIDTHVRRIRKAIDKDGWTYIQTAHGMGYRFEAIHEDD